MRHTLVVILAIVGVLSGLGVCYLAPSPKKLLQQTFWIGLALACLAGIVLVQVW
jgi:hypothetical protein